MKWRSPGWQMWLPATLGCLWSEFRRHRVWAGDKDSRGYVGRICSYLAVKKWKRSGAGVFIHHRQWKAPITFSIFRPISERTCSTVDNKLSCGRSIAFKSMSVYFATWSKNLLISIRCRYKTWLKVQKTVQKAGSCIRTSCWHAMLWHWPLGAR